MAAPALSKTWQHTYSGGHSTNVRFVSSGTTLTDYRTLMLFIKNVLVGFSSSPWACRYSSDGTTAGTAGDLVDRWSSITTLVWAAAGSNHSWIVLRQTGIGSTAEICIDLSNGTSSNATIVFSPGGFSGGSLTARPTAADELVLLSNTTWLTSTGSAFTGVVSVMQSTDGQCTRLIFWRGGFVECLWILDKPASAVSGWTTPFFGWIRGTSGASTATYAQLLTNNSPVGKVRIGTTSGAANLTTEDYQATTIAIGARILTVQDASSPVEYVVTPCGIEVPATVGARGRHGVLADIWAAPSSLRAGDTFPNDSARNLIVAGAILLPWNGEQPRMQ